MERAERPATGNLFFFVDACLNDSVRPQAVLAGGTKPRCKGSMFGLPFVKTTCRDGSRCCSRFSLAPAWRCGAPHAYGAESVTATGVSPATGAAPATRP